MDIDHDVLKKEMSDMISTRIGKFAKPEAIVVGSKIICISVLLMFIVHLLT